MILQWWNLVKMLMHKNTKSLPEIISPHCNFFISILHANYTLLSTYTNYVFKWKYFWMQGGSFTPCKSKVLQVIQFQNSSFFLYKFESNTRQNFALKLFHGAGKTAKQIKKIAVTSNMDFSNQYIAVILWKKKKIKFLDYFPRK